MSKSCLKSYMKELPVTYQQKVRERERVSDRKAGMKKEKKGQKKKSHRGTNLLLVLILLVGIAIAGYPAFSEYWNSLHQSRAIMGYAERVAELSNEDYEKIWTAALGYNWRIRRTENRWSVEKDDKMLDDYRCSFIPGDVFGSAGEGFVRLSYASSMENLQRLVVALNDLDAKLG